MSNILTGFNMQGNDPIDDRIVSKSNLETLEQYLNRVPVQKRYYGLTFFALDKNNELRKYTFQTSLIEPTIDDDEEEIERIDKELQEHVSNKAIHKTSEEIRSEIVDADIPDTIARVQWTLDQINTAVVNLIGGASDEYNTLKRIQTKIEELRAKIYGDDGGTVLKTLEQALKFLNQYKDFIVDIPENFVSKQDIVDNLTTDDPTKVLSAKQGKVLSDTLTNYFESAMQSIRTETDRAINAENRIETKLDKEIDRSIKEDQRIDAKLDAEIKRSTDEDLRIDSKLDSEINRSTTEDDRLDKKIDAETTRATTVESNLNTKIETETDRAEREESRIETKLDNEIARSTNKDTEHDNRLTALEGDTHEQNTDLGTTNSTFQLKYNTGNKIKHESDAISVRNAADTDYVNFIAKNATFKGDLLVEGQSFVTEAETVEIKDNLLLLNKGEVGAGVTKGIAGLEIDRGTEPNYQIIFDESDNRFKAGEIGDIQCLALRDGDDSMVNGMFTSWDSSTKRLKTTNIVPSSSFLYFGDNKTVSLNYSPANDGSLTINTNNQYLAIFTGDNYTNFRSTRNKFQFIGDLYTTGTKYALTFKRGSDNSEVLYHADIVNNLTSGGTNKVLSAEQGKLLQNSITNIQGSYLPLSGGNMTGNIVFNNNLFLNWKDSKGSTYQILSMKSNDEINIGNAAFPLNLYSKADLFHKRNGEVVYRIYDAYNLPDPVTLSGNNTFTGNNTFQAGKFNVGPVKVTSSGSLLLNISIPAGSGWSRNLTFQANSDATSKLVFGGDNSTNDTSAGYAYIGVGDVNYSTAQYKFYSGRLEVPMIWRLTAGSNNILNVNLENNFISLGSVSSSSYIVSNNSDLKHRRFTTTNAYKDYIVWDSYNLPTPANTTDLANYLPLAGGVMTGNIRFPIGNGIACSDVAGTAAYVVLRTWNANNSTRMYVGTVNFPTYISSTASDLIHDRNGSSYLLWDSYNLSSPVTYTTNTYNHATLTNKDGQYFTYIKAGTNGLLPHSKVALASGGSGSLGTSDQSFNAAYINNLHTNKVTFGDAGSFIDNQSGDSDHIGIGFYTSQNAACPVYIGSLCVSDSYANGAPYIPTNGIYSKGVIKSAAGFTSNSRQTNLNLAKTGNDVLYISSFVGGSTGSPGTDSNTGRTIDDGMFLTYFWQNDYAFQLVADIDGTGMAYRHYTPSTGNSTTGWKFLADTNWVVSKINSSTSNFLKKTGDTATGQIILDSNGIAFKANIWTNDLTPNRNYSGYLQVLDAYDASSAGGPTNYGTVLQVNSRNSHWANQLWFPGGAEASKNGLYYRHMAYNQTEYGDWQKILTNKDVNIIPTQSASNPSSLPANQIFYSEIQNVAETPTTKGLLFSVQGDDEGIQLWASSTRTELYYRTKWTSFGNWIKLATTSDIGNYLPLTGGTLSGNLTINTVGSTTLVINNNDTNGSETFMRVLRKGTASAAIGFRDSLGAYIYNYNSNKYLFIDNDGYARVGTTSGSIRLALITDIPSISGYLPLSGGTMTGALTMDNRKNNAVIDVVGGTGNNWNGGAGALSVQVPRDGGQTPLLVARRSGAAIDTTTAAERLLSMELLNTGNTFRITLSNTSTFQLDLSTAKGFLFGKTIATTDQIPSIPSISISNSGSGNAVTAISASGHTLTVTKGATYLTSHQTIYDLTFQAGTFSAKTFDPNGAAATVNIPTKTSHITNDSGFITSSALSGYATQSWANGQFAPLSRFNTSTGYTTIKVTGQEFNFDSANPEIFMNYRTLSGSTAVTKITWKGGSNSTLCEGRWGNLYMNNNLVATQSWASEQFPTKTGTGASGTWGISISGNATTATTASKLGSTTIGGSAKPIYLSSGTPTACSATVGSATVPVYMNAGTITQCSTTLGVSITGNAATATNATQLGGTAASSYVKANDNISRLTNDSGYTTQEWVNGQGFLTSDSILDKFVPTTGGYIRNSDQVLLRLQRTGVSTGTSRTIEMYFDDSNTDGTSTTPRGSIGYNSEVGMFLYSAASKKFLAMEYTGRPFYGTPENRYYLLGSNTQYHNLDGYQRIGDIMIQWGYFTVQGNSTRAINFPVSFTNTVWSVTGSWDNTTTGSQENWGFTDYTSSGFTIINGDGSSRVFHYIAIGPFTRS